MFDTNERGGWIVPACTTIEARTEIPNYSELGNECKLGNGCMLGYRCTLGVECVLEGVTCLQFLTMANVDSTGRQILIIKHAEGVRIRAGCFIGTGAEFLVKAASEGKTKYVAIVGAVISELEKDNA